MLHSEPSFIKLAIVLTALLINIVCVVTIISSFKYTIIISGTGEKYKIYIPEGSITTDFSVDMK